MTRPMYTKPDKNQAQIVEDLRSLGFDVDIICNLPGLYDLVVSGYHESGTVCSVRVEVKSPGGELNDTEERYMARQKHNASYIMAYDTEDVLFWFDKRYNVPISNR